MKRDRINQIFSAYIEKFEYLNAYPQSESYKWVAIADFQRVFDLDAIDFASMLKSAKKATRNIIDSHNQPFAGLVRLADTKNEAETVRELLRALLADDGGNLVIRQQKINDFLRETNRLIYQYFPGSYLYRNDQRSAMAYLFFNDPEHHYLYKATEATYLADCVGYYDNWGPMTSFKLDVYHRFCDQLIAEIDKTPELLHTHKSRFERSSNPMYPDKGNHVLLFDIIYCAHTYGLYSGLSFNKITTAERKLYFERKAKAQKLLGILRNAEMEAEMLEESRAYFLELIRMGREVHHKKFGKLTVEKMEGEYLYVQVDQCGRKMVLWTLNAITNGIIEISDINFATQVEKYGNVMSRANTIPKTLQDAQNNLRPYIEYLD